MTLKSIAAADFIALDVPKRRYVFEPFLPESGLIEIFARTGVGKTTFALALAIAASSGQDFFGWKVTRPWKVLYVDGEMSTQEMQERLSANASHFGMPVKQITNLRLICRDRQATGLPDIGCKDGQSWFAEDTKWADILFLDNLSCLLWSGQENNADDWSTVKQWLLNLKAAGKSVIILHHSGKNGSSRGTSRRHDVLDSVIKLERPSAYTEADGAKFEVHFEKTRGFAGNMAEPVGLVYRLREDLATWEQFKITNEKLAEVAALSSTGLLQADIAHRLGISQGEVSKRLAKARAEDLC